MNSVTKSKKKDLLVNVALNFISLFALFYLIHVAANTMAPVVFGIFMISRRFSGAIANFLQLGTSQTLVRYISIFNNHSENKRRLLIVANLIYAIMLLVVIAVCVFFSDQISVLLFGKAEYSSITFWTIIFASVTSGQFLVFSTAMAERRILLANVINFMTTGGWLLMALLYFSAFFSNELNLAAVENIFAFQTVATAITSLFVSMYFLYMYKGEVGQECMTWGETLRLFGTYGVPRTGITFLDGMTLAIGPWLLRNHPIEAGYLAVALSLLRSLQGILMPITKLSGVFAAHSVGQSDDISVRHLTRLSTGMCLLVPLLGAAFLIFWVDYLLDIWLKNNAVVQGVLTYTPMFLISIVPFIFFNGMKGIVETVWYKPLNLFSLLISFSGFLLAYFFLPTYEMQPHQVVSYAYICMFWALGVMTLLWLLPLLGSVLRYFLIVDWLVAVVAVIFINWVVQYYLEEWGFPLSLFCTALMGVLLLLYSPSDFIFEVRTHIVSIVGKKTGQIN